MSGSIGYIVGRKTDKEVYVCIRWSGMGIRAGGKKCRGGSYAAVQAIHPRLEALYNLANAAHLVEFDLEFVDFAQYGSEAGDFGVGHLDGVAGAVVLHLGCGLCLLCELAHESASRVLCGIWLPHCSQWLRVGRRRRRSTQGGMAHIVPSLLDRVHQTVKVGAERL
jgi:hypothetical protein